MLASRFEPDFEVIPLGTVAIILGVGGFSSMAFNAITETSMDVARTKLAKLTRGTARVRRLVR